MARLTKAALASKNVVALPTAAPRRINNSRFAEQRQASFVERKAGPFAGHYRHWQQREADKIAADLNAAGRTPELLILMLMIQAMPQEAAASLVEKIAPGVVAGLPEAAQALAAVRASRMNLGQSLNLMRALDELRGEGGR